MRESPLFKLTDVLFTIEPLHRHRLLLTRQANFRVFLAQPAHGAAGPKPVESFRSLDVGAVIKAAIAGKDAVGGKNTGYEPESGEFVGQQVDGVTEKGGVGVLRDVGQVGCLALNEFGLRSDFFHALLRSPQSLRRRINANDTRPPPHSLHLLRDQTGDSSGTAGHINDGQCSICGTRCKGSESLADK